MRIQIFELLKLYVMRKLNKLFPSALFKNLERKYFYFIFIFCVVYFILLCLLKKNDLSLGITILWFLFFVFTFYLGLFLGKKSLEKSEMLKEINKQKTIIQEKLYILKNQSLSQKEREEAFWFIVENEYVDKKSLYLILENLEGLRLELKDEVLNVLFKLKEKARDT